MRLWETTRLNQSLSPDGRCTTGKVINALQTVLIKTGLKAPDLVKEPILGGITELKLKILIVAQAQEKL
jgi:hypothetical protein